MDSGTSAQFNDSRGRAPAELTKAVGSSDNACLDSYQSCVNINTINEERAKMVVDDDDV